MNYNNDVCYEIVEKVFPYFYFFNSFVWKYINSVNFLAYCNNVNAEHDNKFTLDKDLSFEYLKIENSLYLEACRREIEKESSP